MTHRLTRAQREHIGRICQGSRLLAELAVTAISLRRLNADLAVPPVCSSAEEFILRHGWLYSPGPFPARYRKWRGLPHGCTHNAMRMALGCPELAYAEGFALPAESVSDSPVPHAWCVDADGNAVDPTWLAGLAGREYCGLSLDKRLLAKLLVEGKPFGIVVDEGVFCEVATGRLDWRKLLAPCASGFSPERTLPS